jgi:hypothetical protein
VEDVLQGNKGQKNSERAEANPKLPTVMTQANPNFVMGKPMLTVGTLKQASKSCVKLHNYYMNNYKKKAKT